MSRVRLSGFFCSVDRLVPHQSHQTPYLSSSDTDVASLSQQNSVNPSARKGILEMQSVNQRHPCDVGVRRPLGAVIPRRSRHPQHLRVSRHRHLGVRVEHLLALSKPALVTAVSNKFFSNVSWPILACRRSKSAFCLPFARPSSKTPAAPCKSSLFQAAICVAWASYFWASSARVCSPRKASSATRPLNAAPWFRRGRLMRCSTRRYGRYLRPTEQASHSFYPPVRESGAASDAPLMPPPCLYSV